MAGVGEQGAPVRACQTLIVSRSLQFPFEAAMFFHQRSLASDFLETRKPPCSANSLRHFGWSCRKYPVRGRFEQSACHWSGRAALPLASTPAYRSFGLVV